MRALGAALAGIHRRPLGIAVLLVVSMVFGAAALTTRTVVLDTEARAELAAQRDRLAADVATATARADAAHAIELAADECVREAAAALEPVVAASARFSAGTVAMGEAVVARVVPASSAVATVEARPASTASVLLVEVGTATRVELIDDLARLSEVRATVGADAAAARLGALERHAACQAADRAVEAVLADVTSRTDQVIAASGMAPADAVAKLRTARDDVLAESEEEPGIEALPGWLAAASEVESTHAAAVAAAAEAAAEAAAAEAARRTAASSAIAPADVRGPGWYTVPELEFSLSEEGIRQCQPDCDPYGTGGTTPPPGWEWPDGLM